MNSVIERMASEAGLKYSPEQAEACVMERDT